MSFRLGQGLRPRIASILANAGLAAATLSGTATNPQYSATIDAMTGLAAALILGTNDSSVIDAADVGSLAVEGVGTQLVRFSRPFAAGAVPANASVTVTDLSDNPIQTSCVRQAFHADGSLRHAVFAASLTGGVSYKLRTAALPSGANLTVSDLLGAVAGDIARIDLTGGVTGSAVLRDLLSSANNRAVNGLFIFEQSPGMLTVVASQNFATHLRVSFILNWFGGANLRVKYLFQNGYGNLPGAQQLDYTAAFLLDGVTPRAPVTVAHKNATMWTPNNLGYWSTGGSLHVRHPKVELEATRAWPRYGSTLPGDSYLNAQRSDTAPMNNGDYRANLDATGADLTLALLPRFDANVIKTGADSRALNTCLANARGGMAYSYHRLSSATGLHMSETEFPNASYNQGVGYAAGFNNQLAPYTPQGSSVSSHVPSVGYTAYLLTGDFDYLMVMLGWTCFTNLWQSVERNFTFNGRNIRQPSNQSLRGMGWQMRTNAQAAYALPDVHPQKQYLNDWVNGNAGLLLNLYGPSGTARNSIGAFFMAEGNDNYKTFFHYLACQSYCYSAFDLGFASLLEIAKYSLILVAGLMGNTLEFPFEAAPSEVKKLGDTPTGAFYSSFTQVRANNVNAGTEDTGSKALALYLQSIDGSHSGNINEMLRQNDPTGYFANIKPCVAYMEEADIADGYGVRYRSKLSPVQPDFSSSSEFDIEPRKIAPPTWVQTLAVNQNYKIPNTALSLVAPSPTPPGNSGVSSVVNTWNGAQSRRRKSKYLQLATGGHADYAGNELYERNLNQAVPNVVLKRAPTLAAQISNNVRRYADGRASSRHTYYNQQFVQALDKLLQMGSASIYDAEVGGRNYAHCDFYDYNSNDWDAVNTSFDALNCAGEKPVATSPSTGFIYYMQVANNNGGLYRYNPKTGNVKTIANTNDYQEIDQCAAVDPIRHRMLIGPNAIPGSGWKYYDLGTGQKTIVSIDVGGDAPQGSLQWDTQAPAPGRFLYCKKLAGANAIYSIHPTTFVATLITLSGETLPTISNPDNVGLFNRMQEFPELGGVAIQTNYTDNLNFIKLYSEGA